MLARARRRSQEHARPWLPLREAIAALPDLVTAVDRLNLFATDVAEDDGVPAWVTANPVTLLRWVRENRPELEVTEIEATREAHRRVWHELGDTLRKRGVPRDPEHYLAELARRANVAPS